jgi:hypothetical protein
MMAGSWWTCIALIVVYLLPTLAQAQDAPALIISLRDAAGKGVAGAMILIRDVEGERDLALATTDAQGRATFEVLDANIVRVAVAGTLADGTPLVQRGLDARGIWLMLDGPQVQLDLRVEPNGAVIPDPATMIAPDLPIEVTPAESAVTLADPSVPTLPVGVVGIPTAPAQPPPIGAMNTAETDQPNRSLMPFVLLALGIGAGVGALIYRRRGDR